MSKRCAVEGCTSEILKGTYCSRHYQQMWKYGEIKQTITDRPKYNIEGDIVRFFCYDRMSNLVGSTIIDLEDLPLLEGKTIYLKKHSHLLYAFYDDPETHKKVRVHRLVMNAPENMVVDHINHDSTDNRKCNLRLCTQAENTKNTRGIGITYVSEYGKWTARITVNYKNIYLGCFSDREEAWRVRREAEKRYFGEYANPIKQPRVEK